ncbi:hypothetical protein EmuJ_000052700 [Echinococcus multilocularis]|uniref:Uncharacterized protein n=1 Tax=Echinococcus multilocularis TaxID=6211 RepID=A0A087VXD4_ECHMU|nr:hypothetical protein EmuJ_000052700 [Echinococcus multilocularis]
MFRGTTVLYFNLRYSSRICNLERPVFHVTLHCLVVKTMSDQTLYIEHSIVGVTTLTRASESLPMRRSPSVEVTELGVVRLPWSSAMISTLPHLETPTQEKVNHKSPPIAGRVDVFV